MKEAEYYESRRQFIELETQAKERAFQKEISRLREEGGVIGARKSKDAAEAAQNQKDAIDNAREVAKAESQLATLRASSSSKITVLNIDQGNSVNKLTESYKSARQAAEAYFESQNRQQGRSLEAFGQGPREAVFTAGVNQIDDNFAQQERELENLKVLGKLEKGEYESRLAIIREFQQKSLASFDAYYNRLIQMQGNAANGANEAVNNYIDNAKNVAASTEQFVSNTFQGLEDSLTRFLTTGKGGFKEFANSIVTDITRIIVKQQIANALTRAMGSGGNFGEAGKFFGALLGSTGGSAASSGAFGIGVSGFAMGGVVERGRIVEVNENNGPGELFNVGNRQYLLASQAGQVKPQVAATTAQRAVPPINIVVNVPPSTDRLTAHQTALLVGRKVQEAMARGG